MTATSTTARRGELGALVALAIPLAAQQVGFQLMGTVDAILLGRYSDAALAAAGLANNLLFAIVSIGFGVVMGLDSVIPQALGGNRLDDARRAVGAGLRLSLLVGIVGTALVLAAPLALQLVHVAPDVLHEATPYLYLRALGVVPFLVGVALRSYLAAHGRTRPLLVAVIAGNVLNAVLDLLLIFGVHALHIPRLGVLGAATATTAVQVLTMLVYAAGVRAIDHGAPRPASTRADLVAIARYGWPVGGQILAEVGIFGIATVLAATMGTVPAAAHAIALGLASFTFSIAFGIANATSVRVGLAAGAGDIALARHRGFAGVKLGLAVMACGAAAFLVAPAALAAIFTDRGAVITAAVPLLQIAALFQLSDGAQGVAAGALRGLGETHATLVGNLLGHYAIGLPISLALAFTASLGAPGLWWGLSAGLTVTAAYLLFRFARSTKQTPR